MRFWPKRQAVFAAAVAILLVGCRSSRSTASESVPSFSLKSLDGKVIRLEDYRGHPVLLDFWATWCYPCRVAAPMVEEFYQRHKDEGLIAIGINMDDDPSNVYAYVKQAGTSYPVVVGASGSVASDFQVEGLPTFVLIDPEGRLVDRWDGFSPALIRQWEILLKRVQDAHAT